VVIFLGIAASSAYQKEAVQTLMPGEMLEVDNYLMRYDGYRLEAVDDHLGAITNVALFDRASGRELERFSGHAGVVSTVASRLFSEPATPIGLFRSRR